MELNAKSKGLAPGFVVTTLMDVKALYYRVRNWRKKTLAGRLATWFVILFVVSKLFAMWEFYGPYKGVVLDDTTGEPIQGAVVLATYSRRTGNLAGGGPDQVLAVEEAVTGKDGSYRIPHKLLITWPVMQLPPLMIFWLRGGADVLVLMPEYRVFRGLYPHAETDHNFKEWQMNVTRLQPYNEQMGVLNLSDQSDLISGMTPPKEFLPEMSAFYPISRGIRRKLTKQITKINKEKERQKRIERFKRERKEQGGE
jgi:hypothetical protein